MSLLVRGGPANSGTKRPLKDKPKPWDCKCRRNPGYLVRCVRCGKGRK